MVKLRAKKKIDIGHIYAILTIKVREERPDIITLLRYLDNLDLSKGENQNLKKYLEYLNLIKNDRLTVLGDKAIESGFVMMPESGLYEIFYIKDRVASDQVIHFVRIRPDREAQGNTSEFTDYEQFDNNIFISWKDSNLLFHMKFDRIGNRVPMVIKKDYVDGNLEIDYDSSKGTLLIVESNTLGIKHLVENYSQFNFEENISKLLGNWDREYNVQLITFDEAKSNPVMITSFKKRISFKDRSIVFPWGKDDSNYNVIIEDFNVLPINLRDAKQWLYSLILLKLKSENSYYTMSYIIEKEKEILKNTPLNKKYGGIFFNESELLDIIRNDKDNNDLLLNIRIAEDLYPMDIIQEFQGA
jgi:hypothetical protein